MVTRRQLLATASAAAVMTVLPLPKLALPAVAGDAVAPLLAFAVGTPGEYNWQHIIASSAEEAWRLWMEDNGEFDNVIEGDPEPTFDEEMVTRVEGWDGKTVTTSADWFAVGLGHVCDRCGYETSREEGGCAVGDDVVCDGCLTWADRLVCGDHDDIVDEIANQLGGGDSEADVRHWLTREKLLPMVDDLGLWAKGVAGAAA